MRKGKCRRTASFLAYLSGIILSAVMAYVLVTEFPMQELKVTAVMAEGYDISGVTDIYCFRRFGEGRDYDAVINFMAVEDTSERLFVSHGTGQYVNLGCSRLEAECGFISFGRFLHVRLSFGAMQADLKLEDGTPFDVTRYSLKPVLTVREKQ